MPIDTRFIDHDLTPPPGQTTGLIEQPQPEIDRMFAASNYGDDSTLMIPRSQWAERAAQYEPLARSLIREIENQGNEGSCVGNGIIGATQAAMNLQFGLDGYVSLSAMSLYKRIGRTAQSGAYIPDGIREMTDRGALPADIDRNRGEFNHVFPERGFSNRLPDGWEQTAKDFRVTKWLKVQGADEFFSALVRGKPIVYGRQSHCIFNLFPTFSGGRWYFAYVNSWSNEWGDVLSESLGLRGVGYDSERTIDNCVGYAAESVSVRPSLHVPGA